MIAYYSSSGITIIILSSTDAATSSTDAVTVPAAHPARPARLAPGFADVGPPSPPLPSPKEKAVLRRREHRAFIDLKASVPTWRPPRGASEGRNPTPLRWRTRALGRRPK